MKRKFIIISGKCYKAKGAGLQPEKKLEGCFMKATVENLIILREMALEELFTKTADGRLVNKKSPKRSVASASALSAKGELLGECQEA